MHKIQRIFTIYIHNIYIYILYIAAYSYWAHIIVCVLSSLSFICVCVCAWGHCVSLSSLSCTTTTQTTTNKCYNNIIIYKTRRPINYIYIYYVCIYTFIYICRIYRPCAQLNARPPVCPPNWTPARPSELTDPPVSPARPSRPFQKPNNQTKPTMCNVRSIKPLYLWMIPKAPNGKPQKNLYHFISLV